MPAQRLNRAPVRIFRYDVAGQDSDTATGFVLHVGLCPYAQESLQPSAHLPLLHMGPPFEQQVDGARVHVLGSVPLTADEIQQISLFVDELSLEYAAARLVPMAQYAIRPHVQDYRADDGTLICKRFSCSGFVIEAYRDIGIDLLRTDDSSLPPVALAILIQAYPDQQRGLQNPRLRARMNLPGDGPWPIVLAGYVLNALNRQESEIHSSPYAAQADDCYFLSQET